MAITGKSKIKEILENEEGYGNCAEAYARHR